MRVFACVTSLVAWAAPGAPGAPSTADGGVTSYEGDCRGCHPQGRDRSGGHAPVLTGACDTCHVSHSSGRPKLLARPVAELCADCHPPPPNGISTHAPFNTGDCSVCHDPHGSPWPSLLRRAPSALCAGCHEEGTATRGGSAHTAIRNGECSGCHLSHASANESLLRATGARLCERCHPAIAQPPAGSTVHRALTSGCETCHVPGHDPSQGALLTKPPGRLCRGCHAEVAANAFNHGAVTRGECTGCHAPHHAPRAKLLVASGGALCFGCHVDDLTGRASTHAPAREGRCLDCHAPHGSAARNSLRWTEARAGCGGCHPAQVAAAKVPHAGGGLACAECHDPHGTSHPAQLVAPINGVCARCHPQHRDGRHATTFARGGHPVTGPSDPRRTGRTFSCASCHEPHGSAHRSLFRSGDDPLGMCEGCHGDRSGLHPERPDLVKPRASKNHGPASTPDGAPRQPVANAPRALEDRVDAAPAGVHEASR